MVRGEKKQQQQHIVKLMINIWKQKNKQNKNTHVYKIEANKYSDEPGSSKKG